jgi:hypothetical protein
MVLVCGAEQGLHWFAVVCGGLRGLYFLGSSLGHPTIGSFSNKNILVFTESTPMNKANFRPHEHMSAGKNNGCPPRNVFKCSEQ